ncbi:MAG: hypothetical protein PHT33_06875 [bacterium]|nr:hypothetical protein [bacterium]
MIFCDNENCLWCEGGSCQNHPHIVCTAAKLPICDSEKVLTNEEIERVILRQERLTGKSFRRGEG